MQMQEQQAVLEAGLQQKQLEVVQAAEQFQPVIANLEKVHPLSLLASSKYLRCWTLQSNTNTQPLSFHSCQPRWVLINSLPALTAGASCQQAVGCTSSASDSMTLVHYPERDVISSTSFRVD